MNQSRMGVFFFFFVSEPRSWVNAEEGETKTGWPWLSYVYKLHLYLGSVVALKLEKFKTAPKLLFLHLVHITVLSRGCCVVVCQYNQMVSYFSLLKVYLVCTCWFILHVHLNSLFCVWVEHLTGCADKALVWINQSNKPSQSFMYEFRLCYGLIQLIFYFILIKCVCAPWVNTVFPYCMRQIGTELAEFLLRYLHGGWGKEVWNKKILVVVGVLILASAGVSIPVTKNH